MNPSASYYFYGLILEVHATEASLLERADQTLGLFRHRDGEQPPGVFSTSASLRFPQIYKVRLSFASTQALEVPDAAFSLHWEGLLPDGLAMRYYTAAEGRRIVIDQNARLDLNFTEKRAEVVVLPDKQWCINHACIIPMLCEILARCGQFFIHTAQLAIPGSQNGQNPRSILISGQSGRGKTTSSLALVRSGMELIADDTSFAGMEGNSDSQDDGNRQLFSWGMRLPCKVDVKTLSMLPWLDALPRVKASTAHEWLVDISSVSKARRILAEPSAIFFLDEPNPHQHQIKPLDKFQSLERLTRENVRATDPTSSGPAGEAFRMFAQLVKTCQTFSLSAGPDLESLSPAILAALAE